MSKVNIIHDGNNFAIRALAVYKGINGMKLFNLEKEGDTFLKALTLMFINDYKRYKGITKRIIFIRDSGSWRKRIYKDYKGNRKKDDSVIHWDNFNKITNTFCTALAKRNVIISKIDFAEGDDLIYFWTDLLKNENNVILSSDRDLKQLVRISNNKFTILIDNAHKKVFANKEFYEEIDAKDELKIAFSPLDMDDEDGEISIDSEFKSQIFNAIRKLERGSVDVQRFLFEKLLTGDKGDNVPSAYVTRKGSRNMGIGPKGAEKIMDSYLALNDFNIVDILENTAVKNVIAEKIRTSLKLEYEKKDIIINNIERNLNLMYLSKNIIPNDILKNIEIHLEELKGIIFNNPQIKSHLFFLKGLLKEDKIDVSNKMFKLF